MSQTYQYVLWDRVPVPEPDLCKWAEWMGRAEGERIVAQDDVGRHFVSTVFLGLERLHGQHGPIAVFETAVFPEPPGTVEIVERYATWNEAEAGHRATVERLRAELASGKAELDKRD